MGDVNVLHGVLAVVPVRHVRAEPLRYVLDSVGEGLHEERVARGDRVVPELAQGRHQVVEHALLVHPPDQPAGGLGNEELAHRLRNAPLEVQVDGRGHRLLVHDEVPVGQGSLGRAFGRLGLHEQRHQVPGDHAEFVVLVGHHVLHGVALAVPHQLVHPEAPHLVAPGEVESFGVRVVGGHRGRHQVVRGAPEALVGVLDRGQRLDRQVSLPFVAPVPRHRHEAAPVGVADGGHAHRLVADVPVHVAPDHVLGWDPAVVAGLDEFLPGLGLVHPEAREIGGVADLKPGGVERVRLVVCRVLVDHGTVPGVFQRRLVVGGSLDLDGLGPHGHGLPLPEVAVLVRVSGVRVVDHQVLVVLPEYRQAPAAFLVVSDGEAGEDRLAAADDVPARRLQVHEVAERGRDDGAVGVVHDERQPGPGPLPVRHPVVGADVLAEVHQVQFVGDLPEERQSFGVRVPIFGGDLLGLEDHRAAEGAVDVQDLGFEQRAVDRRVELELRHPWPEPVDVHERFRPHRGDGHPVVEFLVHIGQESLVAGDHHLLGPGLGEDAEQAELEGQGIRVLPGAFHGGVDAAYEGRDDLVPARVVPPHLLAHVLSEHVETGADVPLQLRRAQDGRDRPRRLPPPHLELEETALGGAVTLDEEEVVLVLGVDVVEPPPVGEDLDGSVEAAYFAGFVLGRGPGGEKSADEQQPQDVDGGKTHGRTPSDGCWAEPMIWESSGFPCRNRPSR